jgi:hypothetical protein
MFLCLLGFAFGGFAQTATMPVVTIRATDPFATWSGDTGTFTLFRDGPTNDSLFVYCRIDGTASNGVDYASITSYVTIPAGIRTNSVVIKPIDLGQTNTKYVVLTLAPSPMLPPVNYVIGNPSNAVVSISTALPTNIPPWVYLVSPTNGNVFYTPVDISLMAFAGDPDGFVATVEFFAGKTSLGIVSNGVVVDPLPGGGTPPGTRAFFLTWSNVPPGIYPLSAKATDNGGAVSISPLVNIVVNQGPPPPPTNIPPVVKISIPTNRATFFTPVNVPICASAYDPDGYVATVEFFADGNSLGIRTNNPASAGPMNPFCLVWSNVPPGGYALTAKATDNGGAVTLSDLVKITVQNGPPPTNFPPVVRITSPPNGAIFRAPVNVPIYTYASDPDDQVVSVEIFAGSNSLGLAQGVCISPVAMPMNYCPSNIYWLTWSNAPVGQYALTAVATDSGGLGTVSAPINVTILPSPPPPTNRPPIVSIVAVDPVAIEGTNCWPWLGLTNTVPAWSNWSGAISLCRYFTNCGPKNATFAVRRYGDTNNDLTITYSIGGTATNGVDYVPLPGSVTIPAGERKALINVVPLDDGPPDINSTVVLALRPSTNSPLDYVLGFPQKAAALILEKLWPPPVSAVLPDKCFHLTAVGPDGAWFHVEYSVDLNHWNAICTNQVVNGSIDFIDPDASADSVRFYRAVPEATPPPQ